MGATGGPIPSPKPGSNYLLYTYIHTSVYYEICTCRRSLRTASIREQVGMYTMQLQSVEDRLGHRDGFETETNHEIEDRRLVTRHHEFI